MCTVGEHRLREPGADVPGILQPVIVVDTLQQLTRSFRRGGWCRRCEGTIVK